MSDLQKDVRRCSDGSIDFDDYRHQSAALRGRAMRTLFSVGSERSRVSGCRKRSDDRESGVSNPKRVDLPSISRLHQRRDPVVKRTCCKKTGFQFQPRGPQYLGVRGAAGSRRPSPVRRRSSSADFTKMQSKPSGPLSGYATRPRLGGIRQPHRRRRQNARQLIEMRASC
jgi:hypothetical protein